MGELRFVGVMLMGCGNRNQDMWKEKRDEYKARGWSKAQNRQSASCCLLEDGTDSKRRLTNDLVSLSIKYWKYRRVSSSCFSATMTMLNVCSIDAHRVKARLRNSL